MKPMPDTIWAAMRVGSTLSPVKPKALTTVLISSQHAPGIDIDGQMRDELIERWREMPESETLELHFDRSTPLSV